MEIEDAPSLIPTEALKPFHPTPLPPPPPLPCLGEIPLPELKYVPNPFVEYMGKEAYRHLQEGYHNSNIYIWSKQNIGSVANQTDQEHHPPFPYFRGMMSILANKSISSCSSSFSSGCGSSASSPLYYGSGTGATSYGLGQDYRQGHGQSPGLNQGLGQGQGYNSSSFSGVTSSPIRKMTSHPYFSKSRSTNNDNSGSVGAPPSSHRFGEGSFAFSSLPS